MKCWYISILSGVFRLSALKFSHCSLLLLLLQLEAGNISEFSIMLAQISPRSTTLSLLIFSIINYEKDWLISLAGTYPESSSAHLIEVTGLIWAALLLSPSPGEEECSGLGERQHSHRASPCHPQAVAEAPYAALCHGQSGTLGNICGGRNKEKSCWSTRLIFYCDGICV